MRRTAIISFGVGAGSLAIDGAWQMSPIRISASIGLGGFGALCFLFAAWQALKGIGLRGFYYLSLDNFAAWRIREWHSDQTAMSKFSPDLFKIFKEISVGAAKADSAFQKAKHEADDPFGRPESVDLLQDRIPFAAAARSELGNISNHAKETLSEDIRRKLETGNLIAKGFLSPYAHGNQKIVIPRPQWVVLRLDGNKAGAKGIEYGEIVIGKRR